MKLIKTFAIATVLVAAAIGQSNTGAGQPQAVPSPSPTPAKAAAAAAKGQTTPAAVNKAATTKTAPATKAAPATKGSPATKTVPAIAPGTVKTGTITPVAGAKTTAATKPASPMAATKTGTQSKPVAPAAVPPTKAGAVVPAPAKKAPVTPDTKKVAAKTTAPKTTAPKTTTTKTTAAKTTAPKKVAATRPAKPVKAGVVEVKTPVAPPLEKKGPAKLMGAAGRRDPFISPIRAVTSGTPTGNCTSGKRCLAIPELILQGTVRDISGKMMAIVITSNHRTYTLRENDQVFNGSVEKITSDSIIFREFVRDAVGRESAREVVKKLSPIS